MKPNVFIDLGFDNDEAEWVEKTSKKLMRIAEELRDLGVSLALTREIIKCVEKDLGF